MNATSAPARPMSGSTTRDTAGAVSGRVERRVAIGIVGAAVVVGAVLRFWPRPALWLDESQSVAFAREPFGSIPRALREDGAPPLYYLLLRAWTNLFGTGTTAVRSLSVVLSLAALGVLGVVARRTWGNRASAIVLVLGATNSFAIRYGSETRMYSLVTLEVAIAVLLIVRWLDGRRRTDLLALALTSAALLYTHYWAIYLLLTALIVVAVIAVRRSGRQQWPVVVPIAAAIIAGFVLWLPWLPTFRFQSRRTATPWARPATFTDILRSTGLNTGWAALPSAITVLTLAATVVAAIVHLRRRSTISGTIGGTVSGTVNGTVNGAIDGPISEGTVGSRTPIFLSLLAVTIGCPVLAVFGGMASHSAYAARYTAVVFPIAILVAGAACSMISARAIRGAIVTMVVASSIVVAIRDIREPRTTAPRIADALRNEIVAGDVVVYCPDQLGPALSRLLAEDPAFSGVAQRVFPDGHPERVNWIDYRSRYEQPDPVAAVDEYDRLAEDRTIWLVSSDTYPPTQSACNGLREQLDALRPDNRLLIRDDPSISDHESLWAFRAASSSTGGVG